MKNEIQLSKDKITLRPLQPEDKADLARLANNKKVWDNVTDLMPHPYAEDDATFFINLTRQEKSTSTFAILFEGQFSGVIGLNTKKGVYRKTADIGYWLGEPFWGKGIMTTALTLLTQYGFEQLGLNRIHAGVFAFNTGSMRVLEKNAYVRDGIFKDAVIKNNQLLDEYRYGLTRKEFLATRS